MSEKKVVLVNCKEEQEVPGLAITDVDAFMNWIADVHTETHSCAAHNEGLLCCLDKLDVREL